MKILWIVNIIFPYPSKQLGIKPNVLGGWLNGLHEELIKNDGVELAIATVYNGKEVKKFFDGKTTYFLIPCKNKFKVKAEDIRMWSKISDYFVPDLVHINGSEFAFGLAYLMANPNVKSVVSIQGLVSCFSDIYLSNISNIDVIKNITIRDILKCDTLFGQQKKFFKRGLVETDLIKKADGIIGRTTWDYANTYAMVLKDKYYFCNESLRDSFYKNKWNIENIKKHTIFISQAFYPIKGFHILLKALNVLKKEYKDVKVYVAGEKIIDDRNLKSKLKINGYAKYLKSLIKKYDLKDNIEFTGFLTESEMIDKLLSTNVFVQASSIENSPNSLGEAMILGMPCVASNVGGTGDLLRHNEEGYLYAYNEYNILAYYIKKIFENDEVAIQMGLNARNHALKTHDRITNCSTMLKIYKDMINEKNN